MNQVIQAIKTRRSVRAYKADAVPEDMLNAVLEAGTYAPTSMGKQSPVIVAVTDKATRDILMKMNAAVMGVSSDPYYGAPVIVLVLADPAAHTYGRKLRAGKHDARRALAGIGKRVGEPREGDV